MLLYSTDEQGANSEHSKRLLGGGGLARRGHSMPGPWPGYSRSNEPRNQEGLSWYAASFTSP